MKPVLKSLFAAFLASNCGLTFVAAGRAHELHVETHALLIDRDDQVVAGHARSDVNVVVAQATSPRVYKDVMVQTLGPKGDQTGMLLTLPDINALVSNAMLETFSNSATGFTSFSRNPVKNAPYSAEVISEKIQTLPDGNQISVRSSSLAYRDSAGRTRQEMRDTKGAVRTIQINDVVEGTRIVISPSTKTATKIGFDKELQKRVEEITQKAKAMAKDTRTPVTVRSEQNGDTVVVKRSEESNADGKKEIREEVKVRVVRVGDPTGHHAEASAYRVGAGESIAHAISETVRHGPIGMSFQDSKWSSKSNITELGARDFEGVRAEGKQRSYTIPAGEIGNKNPITVTSETWYSPELQVTVYSKQSDPRSGDSIYRLANVKRTEQPLSLFSVPADYTVRDSLNIGAPLFKSGLPIK